MPKRDQYYYICLDLITGIEKHYRTCKELCQNEGLDEDRIYHTLCRKKWECFGNAYKMVRRRRLTQPDPC